MDKRTFLKTVSVLALGTLAGFREAYAQRSISKESDFELPSLGFAYAALEPHIDARTMEIHHTKHHAAYINNLNNALKGTALQGKDLHEILVSLSPTDVALRNNAGGHFNHTLFWKTLTPGGSKMPKGKLLKSINKQFDSFELFKSRFSDEAKKLFGSGWTWLVVNKGKLEIVSTPNQDNPLMAKVVANPSVPILGLDVWEHAYYLKYQNRRTEYIEAFFNLINWDVVAENFQKK